VGDGARTTPQRNAFTTASAPKSRRGSPMSSMLDNSQVTVVFQPHTAASTMRICLPCGGGRAFYGAARDLPGVGDCVSGRLGFTRRRVGPAVRPAAGVGQLRAVHRRHHRIPPRSAAPFRCPSTGTTQPNLRRPSSVGGHPHPATGDRIGALVVNPGGPGASAVDTVASMGASLAGSDILRRFDLVGIDPRGVGHSHSQSCAAARRRVRRVPS